MNQIFRLWLDCDGVLADFDKRALELFGTNEAEKVFGPKHFWKTIRQDDFFLKLDLMPEAMQLWEYCQQYDPTILTGAPFGDWAEPQKKQWAMEKFNTDKVIVCLSRNKRDYGKPGDILVDDTLKHRHLWEDMGGVFIHYTGFEKFKVDFEEHINGRSSQISPITGSD